MAGGLPRRPPATMLRRAPEGIRREVRATLIPVCSEASLSQWPAMRLMNRPLDAPLFVRLGSVAAIPQFRTNRKTAPTGATAVAGAPIIREQGGSSERRTCRRPISRVSREFPSLEGAPRQCAKANRPKMLRSQPFCAATWRLAQSLPARVRQDGIHAHREPVDIAGTPVNTRR
jgi:hypothetical protein